jgi:hypothetical protein
MKKDKPTKDKKPPRNWFSLAGGMKRQTSSGPPMKHRLEPQKGATNEQAELLDEVADTYVCTACGIGQEVFARKCIHCGKLGTVIVDGGAKSEAETADLDIEDSTDE